MATKKRKREIQVHNENSFDEGHLVGIDKRRRLERGRSNRRIKVKYAEDVRLINNIFRINKRRRSCGGLLGHYLLGVLIKTVHCQDCRVSLYFFILLGHWLIH